MPGNGDGGGTEDMGRFVKDIGIGKLVGHWVYGGEHCERSE